MRFYIILKIKSHMSIMPEPYEPALNRSDPNYSNSQIINKVQCFDASSTVLNEQKQLVKECCYSQKQKARAIVENMNFQIFITIFTVTSLFMEDIRIIFIDISADTIVDGVNILFILIFTLEIVLSLSVPNYLNSFFFYLDVLSTLSIIMDISILTNLLYSSSALVSGLQLSVIIRNSKASRAAARTVRVMKIFRLARIVKLYKSATKAKELKSKQIREEMNQRLRSLKLKKIKQAEHNLQNGASFGLINSQLDSHADIASNNGNFISKLLNRQVPQTNIQTRVKNKQQSYEGVDNKQKEKSEIDMGEKKQEQIEEIAGKVSRSESKISKLLSDNTMKKIILVILLLMFSVPILDTDNYFQTTSSWDFLSDFIASTLRKPSIPLQKINALILKQIQQNAIYEQYMEQLILFKTPFKQLYYFDAGVLEKQRVNDLAISETQLNVSEIILLRNHNITLNPNQTLTSITIILNCRQYNQIDSWFSIGKILFICVGIIYILNTFNENISQLITQPIEKMLEDVKNNGKSDFFLNFPNNSLQPTTVNNYETTNVHSALTKISNMISKFFGVKGKEHIYQKVFEVGTVAHNYLSSNKKSFCIIGLCTIENYYQISQILKGDVINLNREVSEYLHSAVYRYGGNGVANYEGSFLVAFQIPYEYHHLIEQISQLNSQIRVIKSLKHLGRLPKLRYKTSQKKQNELNNAKVEEEEKNNYVNILADFSIFSLVKTLVKINKEPKFYKYRKDPKLIHALGDSFQIKINCALHAGWVQQGFLGSNLKIDYFYFGKTVQQLKRISHYCRKVSNGLVITNNVYDLTSQGMRRYTRIIQAYSNKQQQFQKSLYLVDLNFQNVSPPKNLNKKTESQINSISLKRILNLEYLKDQTLMKAYRASIFMNSKKELREVMKNVISEEFRRKYIEAYNYLKCGELTQSKEILEQLLNFNREDVLVNRMNNLIQVKYNTIHTFIEQKKDEETEALLW